MGFKFSVDTLNHFKNNGSKLISYKCGNDYIFDMEQVLFTTGQTYLPQFSQNKNEQLFDVPRTS